MNGNDQQQYRKLYRDVLRGYSEFKFSGKLIYIKHLCESDLGDVEADEEILYKDAEERGVLTEKEKLKLLARDKLWDPLKENKLVILKDEISNLQTSAKKLILKNQIKFAQKNIKRQQDIVDELEMERTELIGFTVETYVEKKITSIYLKYSLYTDRKLEEKFFTDELFDDLSDEQMTELAVENNVIMYGLGSKEIKKLSVCSFFMNAISLCSKNPQIFFGYAIKDMTNYQMDLFSSGLRYFSVLEEGKTPPTDLYKDNKFLVEWYDSMLEARRLNVEGGGPRTNRKEHQGGTVVGATEEEMKNFMGQSQEGEEVVELKKEIEKRGGRNLNIKDMIEIHAGDKKENMQF